MENTQASAPEPRTKKVLRMAVLLLIAFVAGLLPMFIQLTQTRGELAAAKKRIELAEVRELAALSFLEVSRNNYGVASSHTSQLFDRLSRLAQSADEPTRSLALSLLDKRDAITGLLAAADPAARVELQNLAAQLLAGPAATP
jgi:hypothetical protein